MKNAFSEEKLKIYLAQLLGYGTCLASALIFLGVVGESIYPGAMSAILIKCGVAVFVFLPILRVAFMSVFFILNKSCVYTIISFCVLLIITLGVVVGLLHIHL